MIPRFIISARLRSAFKACVTGGFIFVGANIYLGSERFYEEIFMPTLRYIDPEKIHDLSIQMAKHGLVPQMKSVDDPILHSTVWNREFKNPIGLAAGFDKNGEAIDGLSKFGFGFIEIGIFISIVQKCLIFILHKGTITPKPQSGNEKPRLFRLTEDRAIINRYGFNNDGYEAVRARLIDYRQRTNANKDSK
ncbi:unnamed protein product [Rotaria sp. Silwood2]|nr:unnamed protein product [Rotaria sp. Silwood2]CAF2852293.1 unnamed protein product [Rotaria sp. Silwood2]CAF2999076.1 unnamed protein product [Rotaria sp. Silwood2]CAF3860290.1 unnamed protein product [Rotaria sp. Silwood2]CAF3917717.1 unnamed protein product [Rotaria sp. Silwood2]